MERESTIAPAAPRPSKKRMTRKTCISVAAAATAVVTAKRTRHQKAVFAASAVGNRSDQQLTSSESPHDVRQPELNHGRGGVEIRCLLWKRRQIEVCYEGTEGGERGKEEQQKMRLLDEAVIC